MSRRTEGVNLADLQAIVESEKDFGDLTQYYRQLQSKPELVLALAKWDLQPTDLGKLVSLHQADCLSQLTDFWALVRVLKPQVFAPKPDSTPRPVNPLIARPDDNWVSMASELLADPVFSTAFMTSAETAAQASTAKFLTETAKGLVESGKRTRYEAVIIGDGPIGIHAMTLLGPLLGDQLVVLTNSQSAAGSWEVRGLYANSPSRVGEVNLPVIGDTTPIAAPGTQSVRVADLVSPLLPALKVPCDDGSVREYAPAAAIARAGLVTKMAHTKKLVLGVEVDIDSLRSPLRDGYRTVRFSDSDGNLYQIEAKLIIFAPGPGTDKPDIRPITDTGRENFYQQSVDSVKSQINLLKLAHANRNSPASQEILGRPIVLPRILSLTIVEDALTAWRLYQNSDLSLDPLNPLYDSNVDIGIVGVKDGGTTIIERLRRKGPYLGRPVFVPKDRQPGIRVYGVDTQEEGVSRLQIKRFREDKRRRYERSVEYKDKVRATPFRVFGWNLENGSDGQGTGVTVYYRSGFFDDTKKVTHDYVFTATGLDTVASKLRNFSPRIYRDLDGEPVGAELSPGVLLAGSANRSIDVPLPNAVRRILRPLEATNSVALWVWGNCVSRQTLSAILRGSFDMGHVSDLAAAYFLGNRDTCAATIADSNKLSDLAKRMGYSQSARSPVVPTVPPSTSIFERQFIKDPRNVVIRTSDRGNRSSLSELINQEGPNLSTTFNYLDPIYDQIKNINIQKEVSPDFQDILTTIASGFLSIARDLTGKK